MSAYGVPTIPLVLIRNVEPKPQSVSILATIRAVAARTTRNCFSWHFGSRATSPAAARPLPAVGAAGGDARLVRRVLEHDPLTKTACYRSAPTLTKSSRCMVVSTASNSSALGK